MNKPTNQGKGKLKTLPNEIGTHHQQFLFQSQCDEDYMKKINMASPTFATTQLGSVEQNHNDKTLRVSQANKENIISLSLKQYKNNEQSDISNKQNKIQFMKARNEQLVEKCTEIENQNKSLVEQNIMLKEKLKVFKFKLNDKVQKILPYYQMNNTSSEKDNVDLYLEFQVFKNQYKSQKKNGQKLAAENEFLQQKNKQLQQIILNYTQKSEKKKNQKEESQEKIIKLQKIYTQKLQQVKKKSQLKSKQFQMQKIEHQNTVKKMKEEYEKLKFLKEQIAKKRQEDSKYREEVQNSLKQKEQNIKFLKDQCTKYEQQYKRVLTKLASYSQNSQSIQEQLTKSQEELQKLKLSFSSLQAENSKLKHNLQNYKLINQKYSQQITCLRKQNQQFFENIQNLKIEKDKQECIIQKHVSNEQRQTKRINQLQLKINDTQKQMQEIKVQFEQWLAKNSSRSHPNISKFKQQEEESQKQITSRGSQGQRYSINSERIRKMEDQFNAIIQSLNKEIQQLRKSKETLQSQLFSQREKYEKINLELQNTYRKIEQFNYNQCDRDGRDKNIYSKKGDPFGTSSFPFELTRATKATPQLKMIKQILSQILSHREIQEQGYRNPTNAYRQKDRDHFPSIEDLIQDIKNLAQEAADFFDDQDKQIADLVRRIKHKEQVISKLLRFTPQQKKACILEYLKVMQAYQEYPIQQVYKVTRVLEQEANQWKRNVNNLIDTVEKNEQQVMLLRKQVNKYKSDGGNRRNQSILGNGDRFQKFQKQRHQRYPQKWQYQRKRY